MTYTDVIISKCMHYASHGRKETTMEMLGLAPALCVMSGLLLKCSVKVLACLHCQRGSSSSVLASVIVSLASNFALTRCKRMHISTNLPNIARTQINCTLQQTTWSDSSTTATLAGKLSGHATDCVCCIKGFTKWQSTANG